MPNKRQVLSRFAAGWLACLCLSVVTCGETRQPETESSDSTASAPVDARPARPGIRFDPATLRVGTQIGELVVDSVAARLTPIDSTYVGVARFRNEITLRGSTMRHPDSDLRDTTSCFEADSSSAARFPRWAGDERRAWFCFANRAAAARALGTDSVRATIVIDAFTIHRGLSDEVNSARFVRLIELH